MRTGSWVCHQQLLHAALWGEVTPKHMGGPGIGECQWELAHTLSQGDRDLNLHLGFKLQTEV